MLPPPIAPGVMPTMEPPGVCPDINTRSTSSSISSGVVLVESLVPNSFFDSCPRTDHGRGLGAIIGVFIMPFPGFWSSECWLLTDSLLGDFSLSLLGALFSIVLFALDRFFSGSGLFFTRGDFLFVEGETFPKLSEDRDLEVQLTFFIKGEARSNLIGLRSSRMGVVSPDVTLLKRPPSSRLSVGLSTKDNELHSSDVGETSGVRVDGVAEPGLKKASIPSLTPAVDPSSVMTGFFGARVLARFGRPEEQVLTSYIEIDR